MNQAIVRNIAVFSGLVLCGWHAWRRRRSLSRRAYRALDVAVAITCIGYSGSACVHVLCGGDCRDRGGMVNSAVGVFVLGAGVFVLGSRMSGAPLKCSWVRRVSLLEQLQ